MVGCSNWFISLAFDCFWYRSCSVLWFFVRLFFLFLRGVIKRIGRQLDNPLYLIDYGYAGVFMVACLVSVVFLYSPVE